MTNTFIKFAAGIALCAAVATTATAQTQLRPFDCGRRNVALTSFVGANFVAAAESYTFNVIRLANPNNGQAGDSMNFTTPRRFLKFGNTQVNAPGFFRYGGDYRIRVQANDANGNALGGGFGPLCRIFLVDSPVTAGTTFRAFDCGRDSVDFNGDYLIALRDTTATRYKFIVYSDSAQTNVVAASVQNRAVFRFQNNVNILPNSTYYITVATGIDNVFGNPSVACSFTTSDTAMGGPRLGAVAATTVSAYPNPFQNEVTIEGAAQEIRIMDATGRTIQVIAPNAQRTTIGAGLRAGVYTIAVRNEGTVETLRVVKTN